MSDPGPEGVQPVDHPLAALTVDEVSAAVAAVRADGRLTTEARFASISLEDPPKDEVRSFVPGGPVRRRIRLVIVPGPGLGVIEAVVTLPGGEVTSWEEVEGVRPALLFEDSMYAIGALKDHPDWQAAMRRRGITDFDLVQIDPWPAGSFGSPHEEGRRISRCISFLREHPFDNGYARPVEGVIGFVDMGRRQVLEVVDHGVVPLPPEPGNYRAEDTGPPRPDLRPLEITQPEGPSFVVDGNLIRWQHWSLRVTMDPAEGLVLHTVGYEDGGRVRPVLHRASISEMVVPYGDPGPVHGWKNAFDAGEWGLGRMTTSLALGCDCLGVIHYLDAVFATEQGHPYTVEHAVCLHEEDYGILWKHVDMATGRSEVRRSRRLVVSFIATVGNYDYGYFWYFYLDGTIQLEVKLTGIMSTQAVPPGETPRFAPLVAPQLAAPVHQHLFNVRLDVEVDGPDNAVEEVEAVPLDPGPDNPWGNAFEAVATLLTSEAGAQRTTDPARSRHWRVVNRAVPNRLGRPVAYKLVPGPTPVLLASAGSSIAARAGFATRNLWVTPFDPAERRAAGEYPNQHPGGDGLPRWTAADRPLVDRDIVLWYTFGITHLPRPEDWPVMPVEYAGFHLVPVGFFDRNPALDVPATTAGHCHSD